MALPANVTTRIVTGNLVWLDGSPAKGSVTFLPSIEYLLDPIGDTNIYMYEVTEVLDTQGHFDVPLITTDDPDLNPVNWTYTVRILLTDPSAQSNQHKPVETIFSMALPAGASSLDIADATPVQSSPGNAVTKGEKGDPGQVVSVNGKTGAVVLTATDVGAEPVGSTTSVQSALNQHVTDPTAAHASTAIAFTPAAGIQASTVQAAIVENANDLAAHIGSVGTVHVASAVAFTPAAGIAATNIQSAIVEDAGDLANHLADTVDAHDASAISVVPGGTIASTTVQTALTEVANDAASALTTHTTKATGAHAASAVSFTPSGTIAAMTVQEAVSEVATEAAGATTGVQTNLTAHLNDGVDAHDATAISFAPGSGIAALTVQAAILEDAADLAAHLVDSTAAHAASAVSFTPTAGIAANTVQAAIVEDAGDLAAHLGKLTAAHVASAIAFTPVGTIGSTTVQDAINETAEEAKANNLGTATSIANHLADAVDAHDASAISFVPFGTIQATTVQAAIVEAINESVGSASGVNDHINDPTDAHDASAISFVPSGSLSAINVQAAVLEVSSDVTTMAPLLTNHLDATVDAHDATAVSFIPTGTIAATQVQAAVAEVSGDVTAVANNLATHVGSSTNVHAAAAVSFSPLGAITSTDVQAAVGEVATKTTAATAAVDQRVSDHLADTIDAHDASAISILDAGGLIVATDVEGALGENRAALNTHANLTTTAHGGLVPPARTISVTAPITGGGDLTANRTIGVSTATETATGVVELATTGESTTGTDQTRAVHPAGMKAAIDARNIVSTARLINTTAPLSGGGALSGDLTLVLSDNGVTNAKLTDMTTARIKGRVTTGTGDPEDLTGTQATTLLDTFTTALKGLVPPPTTATGKFLKDDGTWATVLDQTAGDARYINVTGDTMTGVLRMPAPGGVGGQIVGTDGADVEQGSIRIGTTESVLKHNTQTTLMTAGGQRLIVTTTGILAYLPITVQADPTSAMHVATKQYVDGRVAKTGDTMTGALRINHDTDARINFYASNGTTFLGNVGSSTAYAFLNAAQGLPLHLMVNGAIRATIDNISMSSAGPISLPADPTSNLQAATKQYVDARVPMTRTISTTAPLSGGGDLTANRTLSITSATESVIGAIELATQAETDAGTDDARAITPLKLAASLTAKALTKAQPINTQTGTTYTLVLLDAAKLVSLSNAGAVTLTVPNDATTNFPIGSFIDILRYGTGTVTVSPQSPVAIRATPSAILRAQYSGATLVKIAADEWSLVGDLA